MDRNKRGRRDSLLQTLRQARENQAAWKQQVERIVELGRDSVCRVGGEYVVLQRVMETQKAIINTLEFLLVELK